ncbi:hypothetical protein [Solibacillus sp. NPDC093137]|uniref:hypothetical protein n=1 Tax=Solibacillus sp. NPDC093137 TaxID=3390678 RepID=UPI003D041E86
MLLEPKALENIIVGVLIDNHFKWYVSQKDLWFLDRKKLEEAYRKKLKEVGLGNMGPFIEEDDERKDIDILDQDSYAAFAPRIVKYAVSTKELRESLKLNLLTETKENTFYSFMPSLFVNFDKRELYSLYSEPASYEDFVPENWTGVYEDFLSYIDRAEKYWYDENEFDLLNLEGGSCN